MRTFLHHDSDSGELRLVMTDYWEGQHERTEFRVINDDGTTVRRGQEFDGLAAYRFGSVWQARRNSAAPWITFSVQPRAIGETVKTPCPKAANRRRKCALCA